MFGKLGAALGKVAETVGNIIDSIANEEELDGVVAAAVLIAAADGNIDEAEKETAFKAIQAHPGLKGFDQRKVREKFDSDATLINSDRILATEVLEDKIKKISEKVARIRVLGIATQIANADGNFSDSERKVVDKIRRLTA